MDNHLGEKLGSEDAENGGFKGWLEISKTMRVYDEALVKRWNEEIDTLLVFAGLFSAVLTTFALEAYKLLKEDSEDRAADLLQSIAWQLGNYSSAALAMTPLTPMQPATEFHISSASLRVNTIWLTSLVLSLSSALLGILVKQWLREYLNWGLTSPRDSVRMRQFRYEGLEFWRVPDVVAALPLMLQTSLLLFFIGLLDLLWTINQVIASCITVAVSITLSITFISAILPFFSANCPYKSPLALQMHRILNRIVRVRIVRRIYRQKWQPSEVQNQKARFSGTWWEHDFEAVQHHSAWSAESVDQRALDWTFRTLLDDDFQDIVSSCVMDLPKGTKAQFFFAVLARYADIEPHKLLDAVRSGITDASEVLQRPLLRAGRRTIARLLGLSLDVLSDAMPDLRRTRSTSASSLSAEPFSLFTALPGIAVDASTLRRSDLLITLYPLLSAFVASSRPLQERHDPLRAGVLRKALDTLVDAARSSEPASETQMTAFSLLFEFGPLFKDHVVAKDVLSLITISLQGLAPISNNAALPMTRAGVRYSEFSGVFFSASAIAVRYVSSLRPDILRDTVLRGRIRDLLRAMGQHVNACNLARQRYAHGTHVRALWCWDLLWLARKDPELFDYQLVNALAESDRLGQITTDERAGLIKLQSSLGLPIATASLHQIKSSNLSVSFIGEAHSRQGISVRAALEINPDELTHMNNLGASLLPLNENAIRTTSPLPLLHGTNEAEPPLEHRDQVMPGSSDTMLDVQLERPQDIVSNETLQLPDDRKVVIPDDGNATSPGLTQHVNAQHLRRQHSRRPHSRKPQLSKGDFVCLHPGCGKAFARHIELKSHIRTHYPLTSTLLPTRLAPSRSVLTDPLRPRRRRTIDTSPGYLSEPRAPSPSFSPRRQTIDTVPPQDNLNHDSIANPPLIFPGPSHRPSSRPQGPRPPPTSRRENVP